MTSVIDSSTEFLTRHSRLRKAIQLWRQGQRREAHEEMEKIVNCSTHPVVYAGRTWLLYLEWEEFRYLRTHATTVLVELADKIRRSAEDGLHADQASLACADISLSCQVGMLHYFATKHISESDGCNFEEFRSNVADECAVYLQMEFSDWISPTEDLYPGILGSHERYFHAVLEKFKNFRNLAKLSLVELSQMFINVGPGPVWQDDAFQDCSMSIKNKPGKVAIQDVRDIMIETKLERLWKESACEIRALEASGKFSAGQQKINKEVQAQRDRIKQHQEAKNFVASKLQKSKQFLSLLGNIKVSVHDLERRITKLKDKDLKALCMVHIRKFRTCRMWHLYSNLTADLDRPCDTTMRKQLKSMMASELHDYDSELVRECHGVFTRKAQSNLAEVEASDQPLLRSALAKFRYYTSCLIQQLSVEGFSYHMHDEVLGGEDLFELLPEGKQLALYSPEYWSYSNAPQDVLKHVESIGKYLLDLIKGSGDSENSQRSILADESDPGCAETRLISAQLKGYIASQDPQDVRYTPDVYETDNFDQDCTINAPPHSVVCTYDELLKLSVVRDEQLKQSYIRDIWLALNVLHENDILSLVMLQPVVLFVKRGIKLEIQKQVDNATDFDILGYIKDLPILWVQEIRHFLICHLGLRGQLTDGFYYTVQIHREEQYKLDIEIDAHDRDKMIMNMDKVALFVPIPECYDTMDNFGRITATPYVESEALDNLYSTACQDSNNMQSYVSDYHEANLAMQNLRDFSLYHSKVKEVIAKCEADIAELRLYASAIVDSNFEVCSASDVQDLITDLTNLTENLCSEILRWDVGKYCAQSKYHNSQIQAINAQLKAIETEITEISSSYHIEKSSPLLQNLPPECRDRFLHLHQIRECLFTRRQNYFRQRHIGYVQHMYFLQTYNQYNFWSKDVSCSNVQIFDKVAWTYTSLDPSGTLQGIVQTLVENVETLLLRLKTTEDTISICREAKYLRARQCAISCAAASMQTPPSELLSCARDLFRESVDQIIKDAREHDARESEISLLHQLDEEKSVYADKEKLKSRKTGVKKKLIRKDSSHCVLDQPHMQRLPMETSESLCDKYSTDVRKDSSLSNEPSNELLNVNLQDSDAKDKNAALANICVDRNFHNVLLEKQILSGYEGADDVPLLDASVETATSHGDSEVSRPIMQCSSSSGTTNSDFTGSNANSEDYDRRHYKLETCQEKTVSDSLSISMAPLQGILDAKQMKQGNENSGNLDDSEKRELDTAVIISLKILPEQETPSVQPENLSCCVFGQISSQNPFGKDNGFLNAIIQCVWHLTNFRITLMEQLATYQSNDFLKSLFQMFVPLNDIGVCQNINSHLREFMPKNEKVGNAVLTAELCHTRSSVQEEHLSRLCETYDAGAVLDFVMSHMKKCSFANHEESFDDESPDLECHKIFHCQYRQAVPAMALRRSASCESGSSMGSIIGLALKSCSLLCGLDHGRCGVQNTVSIALQTSPGVFILELEWASDEPSRVDLQETLNAMEDSVDLGEIYPALEVGMHSCMLKSMFGYQGAQYKAFLVQPDSHTWMMFEDENVLFVGSWENAKEKCLAGRVKPSFLFFEPGR